MDTLAYKKSNSPPSVSTTPRRPIITNFTHSNQVSAVLGRAPIQAKLKIGAPNDKYEQEADRVADQVMSMPEPALHRQSTHTPLVKQNTPLVQRQVDTDVDVETEKEREEVEEPNQPKPISETTETEEQNHAGSNEGVETEEEEQETSIQRKAFSNEPLSLNNSLQTRIQSLKGGGQPLPGSERAFFEPLFGANFGDVRVHNDTRAAQAARMTNARAFTFGQDVVFGAGQYQPQSKTGQQLLAHELTHIIQNTNPMHHAGVHSRIQTRWKTPAGYIQRAPLKGIPTGRTSVVKRPPPPKPKPASRNISLSKAQCKKFWLHITLAETLVAKYLTEVAKLKYPGDFSKPKHKFCVVHTGKKGNIRKTACYIETKEKGNWRSYKVEFYWPRSFGILTYMFGFNAWISKFYMPGKLPLISSQMRGMKSKIVWYYKLHCPPKPW